MNRRAAAGAAGAVAAALLAGACGLGDKQAHADRITSEGKRLMAQASVGADIAVTVKVLPPEREVVLQEPPRIAAGALPPLPAVIRPRANAASLADIVRFVDDTIYERIPPKVVAVGNAALGVPSNLVPILAAATKTGLVPEGVVDIVAAPSSSTTTTATTAPRTLRRTVQIVREWAAFDFAKVPDRDQTRHGGSFAINPVALLRLTTGVLTGSVERVSATEFKANVSRDKAERKLSEDAREILDKMFTANAVTRRVFPARFRFGPDGRLESFAITLRQQLSSSRDRADLTVSLALRDSADAVEVTRPPRRGTVTVETLGQLVTTVSAL